MRAVYVDSCIPMYLVGSEHPLKVRVIELLQIFISTGERFVTSAEAFQEILHRYRGLGDRKHLNAAYQAMEELVDEVLDVGKHDVDVALALAGQFEELSSRDCLHVALMRRTGLKRIWTYDRRFDEVPSIQRLQ